MKEKEKPKLISTGNDGYRYRYEIRKKNSFKKLFLDFMKELGFDKKEDLFYFNKTYEFDKESGEEELVNRDITKINNHVENYRNDKFDVDLIYFEKTIVIVVRTGENDKLVKIVNKYFKFEDES